MDKYKEIFRIKFEYFKRTEIYKKLKPAVEKARIEGSHPIQHVIEGDAEKKRKLGLFILNPCNCFLLESDSFDIVWNNIVGNIVLQNTAMQYSSLINTTEAVKDFLQEQIIFYFINGRFPTFSEVYSAFMKSSFADSEEYLNISIPLKASISKKAFMLAELDKIKNHIEQLDDVTAFEYTQELIGVYGKPQMEKLKRYLGVYILRDECRLSYGKIAAGKYDAKDEFSEQVKNYYSNRQRADPQGGVKKDYKLAKKIIANTENGHFPYPQKTDDANDISQLACIPPLFSPIVSLEYKSPHSKICSHPKRRSFRLKCRGGKQALA